MTLSKRTRFEVLKRDGFRCRYCGTSSLSALLHVDHVIPRAEGGSDDPTNLVAACAACNLGKSDVQLDDSRLPRTGSEQLAEQAEQMRGYMEAVRAREGAAREAADWFVGEYKERVCNWPPKNIAGRFMQIAEELGPEKLLEAFDAVGRRMQRGSLSCREESMYFSGVIRNMKIRAELAGGDGHGLASTEEVGG